MNASSSKGAGENGKALVELCEQLLPGNGEFADDVRLAIDAPADYVKKFAKELQMLRGINKPSPELPWIAFIDGLVRNQRLTYLDWRFDGDEMMEGFNEQLESLQIEDFDWSWFDEDIDGDDEESWQEKQLKNTSEQLSAQELTLLQLDSINPEDAYAVVVLEKDRVPAVEKLVKQSGFGTTHRW